MKHRKILSILALILCLAALVELTGCATSSNSKTRGSRGKLSDATAEAAGKEDGKGRGEGRTRTKDDANTYNNDDSDSEVYHEEDSGGGTPFLIGLILSIFTGGGDDDDKQERNENRKSYPSEYGEAGDRAWNSYSEFGPYEDGEDGSGEDSGDGGGFDIRRSNLNAWYSLSRFGGDAIENFSTATVMYSVYRGTRYRANIGLYYGRGNPGSQQNLEEGLRYLEEGGIDLGARGYLTPGHSLMGVYVLTGIRLGVMTWTFTNAITVPDGSGGLEDLDSDGAGLLVPYIGIGASLLQTKSVHLGVNFTVGGRFTGNNTFEDFENDVFLDVAEYKLNFEASFFF
ncbi:MAG: hypothetical protein KAH56_02060 [Candidatus Krumholzibacteria bacterium]|nr:hypothetical protein [Candidatus Krumholzibacteria bacterium]